MKRLLLCVALLLSVAASAQSDRFSEVAETVRPVHDAEGDIQCSAVAIAPGVAITARHCLEDGMAVDGRWVSEAVTYEDEAKDIAIVLVPGLQCPCAEIGKRPEYNTDALAVGFPGGRHLTVSAVGVVTHIGPGAIPDAVKSRAFPENFLVADYIIVQPNIVFPGNSGGGLFVMQEGKWVLVGITSIMLADPTTCIPFFGCAVQMASGFIPVDLAGPLVREILKEKE